MYQIFLSKYAAKHKRLLKQSNLEQKAKLLLEIIASNPFQNPPPYEKLAGDFKGAYSRSINRQHRLVYTVDVDKMEVYVLSMWTHYE